MYPYRRFLQEVDVLSEVCGEVNDYVVGQIPLSLNLELFCTCDNPN